jgi:pimeloyl-ACP methyl ester carboxylesterase
MWMLLGFFSAPAFAARLGALEFTHCMLKAPAPLLATTDAQCAKLTVPEDRSKPDGRKIDLAIAWIPARTMKPAADPVFLLAGGPGQSALDTFPGVEAAFGEILRRRHVVLVDQRGTGASHALKCKNEPPGLEEEDSAAAAQFAKECIKTLDADPQFYSTAEAVDDLDAVRKAIGAPQINVVGVSYGTRVAQQYAKRFGPQTRAMVLDGIVPNTLVLGTEHASNLEAALDLQFAQCTQQPACSQRFSPRADLKYLMAALRKSPFAVSYRDPVTAEPKTSKLGPPHLALWVRMFAYSSLTASLLPVMLHEAANGRPEALVASAKSVMTNLEASLNGMMELSVTCTEDADETRLDPADADTTLGSTWLDMRKAMCTVWPHHARAADFRRPLSSDVAALLVSGEFDPVTPPRYGEEVVRTLPKGRHLVLKGQGHNVFAVGCMPKLLGRFFETANAGSLDASCLDVLRAMPPFISLSGTEP